MNKSIVRVGLFGLVAIAAMGLGGCNNGLKEENTTLRNTNEKLTSENETYKTQLTESEARRGEAESKASSKDAELNTLRTQLANQQQPPQRDPYTGPGGGKPTTQQHKSERIVVAGDVLFAPGSVTLTSGGKKELDKVIANIKSKHAGDSIRVEGYTDSDPPQKIKDKYPTNKALSKARAESVEAYMASKGISASRISTVGMGSENPKATKAASRRVEIVVVDN